MNLKTKKQFTKYCKENGIAAEVREWIHKNKKQNKAR